MRTPLSEITETRSLPTEKFEAMKRGLKSQQSSSTKLKTEQEAATRASFRVAFEIAKLVSLLAKHCGSKTSLKIYPLNCSTKMDMLSDFLWPWMSQRMCRILLRSRIKAMKYMKNFLICIVFMAQLLVQIFLKELKWSLIKRTFDGNLETYYN
nr:unnamed protein product [Callosobruchus analis]